MDKWLVPCAVVVGAVILAATFRYDYQVTGIGVLRVDRLTSQVEICPVQRAGQQTHCWP